jgi:hypothetical protein
MARRRRDIFTSVRSEGGLLPPDFLRQVAEGRKGVPGLTPEAYHLAGSEKLNEAASRSWNRLLGAWAAFQATAVNRDAAEARRIADRDLPHAPRPTPASGQDQ